MNQNDYFSDEQQTRIDNLAEKGVTVRVNNLDSDDDSGPIVDVKYDNETLNLEVQPLHEQVTALIMWAEGFAAGLDYEEREATEDQFGLQDMVITDEENAKRQRNATSRLY